jgi:antiviral helicase SKI2
LQINSTNELILTELILENTLATYTPEETVALLSAFVFQEKTDVDADRIAEELPPSLNEGKRKLEVIEERVSRIQDRHKVVAAEFQNQLKFGLMQVVYEWAKGVVRIIPTFGLEILK